MANNNFISNEIDNTLLNGDDFILVPKPETPTPIDPTEPEEEVNSSDVNPKAEAQVNSDDETIVSDTPFTFDIEGISVDYTKSSHTVGFTNVFNGTVNFSYSDSASVGNAKYFKASNKVTFDMLQYGGANDKTFVITARTMPDYDVEAIVVSSNPSAVCFNKDKVNFIKYMNVDGYDGEYDINGEVWFAGQVPNNEHKILIKFVDGYDGEEFFEFISSVKSVRVSLPSVGGRMFSHSNITEVMFCNGVKSIGFQCCFNSDIGEVWLPDTLTYIRGGAFEGSRLANIHLYCLSEPIFEDRAFANIEQVVDLEYVDVGTPWYIDVVEEIEMAGSTVRSFALDYPEEGNEYDMYIYQYYGVMEGMEYERAYYQNEVKQLTSTLNINQTKTHIFKEYNVSDFIGITLPTNNKEYISYRIVKDNQEIFEGRHLCIADEVTIKINDVIQQHIVNEGFEIGQNIVKPYINYGLFEIYYSYDEWENEYELDGVLKVYNDWTYDNVIKTDTNTITEFDINPYQPTFVTFNLKKNVSATYTITQYGERGTRQLKTGTFTQQSIFICLFPAGSDYSLGTIKSYTVNIVPNIGSSFSYTFNVKHIGKTSKSPDAQMRIIYRNKKGGYSSLSFNRTSKMNDSIAIDSYVKNSEDIHTMQTVQFGKNITTTWTCNTNWIPEKYSDDIADAFASTECYLQTQEQYSLSNYKKLDKVNITSTSVDRKTFYNQGRKFIQYQFKLEFPNKKKFI